MSKTVSSKMPQKASKKAERENTVGSRKPVKTGGSPKQSGTGPKNAPSKNHVRAIRESDSIPVRTVVKNGIPYVIPYDPDTGKVPLWAIYNRFYDVDQGSRTSKKRSVLIDLGSEAKTVHKPPSEDGWTPEELVATGWWEYPNESDLLGVDNPSTAFTSPLRYSSKKGNKAGAKIAILTPQSETVRKVLEDNFTGEEILTAVKDGGLVITTGYPEDPEAGGYYRAVSDITPTAMIMLRPDFDEDTVTHEMVHHLRRVDRSRGGPSRCPYPLDEDGYNSPVREKDVDYSTLEEAATVAEAAVRTRSPSDRPTGYYLYTDAGRKNYPGLPRNEIVAGVKKEYAEDRNRLVRGAPLRGKRAAHRVNEEFGNLNIATMQRDGERTAAEEYKVLGERGLYPKPEKPARKPKVLENRKPRTGASRRNKR